MNSDSQAPRSRLLPIILLLLGFLAGLLVSRIDRFERPLRSIDDALRSLTRVNSAADFNLFSRTWNVIQERYVARPIDEKKLLQGALDGLVNSLDDPYSFYLNPEESGIFADEINGKFFGIGVELGLKDDRIVVIAPLSATPAERAGLQAGDGIIAIDGSSTEGLTLENAVTKIRGQAGTTVVLKIARGQEDPRDIPIKRDRIQIKSVKLEWRAVDSGRTAAIVTVSSFTQDTDEEFAKAVQEVLLRQPTGLILDLRNNPGGYLDSAILMAEAFLKDGSVVIEDYGQGKQQTINARGSAPLDGYKVVVLINGGTASAAEILAGALQDRRQVPVVGTKSFGKGSVQEIEDLPDGSSVKLTIAHWLTPNGRSIDKTGIEPTEVVEGNGQTESPNDSQLNRALELIAK
ncbi:MAG: S41 family peptidase [Candidatus Kerfeldbacteria bacterium]|nr:S41 family peptidase [Candidatus Kerfeldbacteria bacterium]